MTVAELFIKLGVKVEGAEKLKQADSSLKASAVQPLIVQADGHCRPGFLAERMRHPRGIDDPQGPVPDDASQEMRDQHGADPKAVRPEFSKPTNGLRVTYL